MSDLEPRVGAGSYGTLPRKGDVHLEPQQIFGLNQGNRQRKRRGHGQAWLIWETSLWLEPRKKWRRMEGEAGERGGPERATGAPEQSKAGDKGVRFELRRHPAGCSDNEVGDQLRGLIHSFNKPLWSPYKVV